MRARTSFLLIALICTAQADAQTTPGANAGSTVRVWSSAHPDRMLEGMLHVWTADSVTFSTVWRPRELQGRRLALPTESLSRLDVERARTRNEGFKHGLRNGLLTGLVSAVAVGLALSDLGAEDVFAISTVTFVSSTLGSAGTGYISPGRMWQQVYPTQARKD